MEKKATKTSTTVKKAATASKTVKATPAKTAAKTAKAAPAKPATKTVKTAKAAPAKPATKTVKATPAKPAAKTATPAKPAAKTATKATTAKTTAAKTLKTVKATPAKKATPVKTTATAKATKTVKATPAKKATPVKTTAKTAKASKTATPPVEKTKYSPEELQEFKELILSKIAKAEKDLELLQQAVAGSENDVSDTAPTFKTLEEGSNVLLKEENQKLAARQQKFIRDLRAALIRIENGTYGICQKTGKLIPKARLMIVPHATMTVEAKEASKRGR